MRSVALVLALAGVVQTLVEERSAAGFVRTLQQAVARNDRTAVAGMIRYPLTVFTGGVRIPIADASELVQSYDVVFSPSLKLVIAEAKMRGRGSSAPPFPVDIDGDRITIAGDAVQIDPVAGRLLITAIHAPLAATSAGAGSSAARAPRGGEPRRIGLRFGRIEHLGMLGRGQRDRYLLSARKNQVLDVRITGVKERDIVLEIVNVKARAPIDSKAGGGVRTWVGRIPEDADYRIDVVRRARAGAAQLPYTLVVSLR